MCDNRRMQKNGERCRKGNIEICSEISNPDLADDMSKVRELNDRINKLLRTKWFGKSVLLS